MAKIQDLQVTTIKIKTNALTQWFTPYASAKKVDIPNDSLGPSLMWVSQGSGTVSLVRDPTGTNVTLFTVSGHVRDVYHDEPQGGTTTYELTGSGDGVFVGAMVRYK